MQGYAGLTRPQSPNGRGQSDYFAHFSTELPGLGIFSCDNYVLVTKRLPNFHIP